MSCNIALTSDFLKIYHKILFKFKKFKVVPDSENDSNQRTLTETHNKLTNLTLPHREGKHLPWSFDSRYMLFNAFKVYILYPTRKNIQKKLITINKNKDKDILLKIKSVDSINLTKHDNLLRRSSYYQRIGFME